MFFLHSLVKIDFVGTYIASLSRKLTYLLSDFSTSSIDKQQSTYLELQQPEMTQILRFKFCLLDFSEMTLRVTSSHFSSNNGHELYCSTHVSTLFLLRFCQHHKTRDDDERYD